MMQQLVDIEKIVAKTIVIYTDKRPNPKSGKRDCNATQTEKMHFRSKMKRELLAAKTEQERQSIIDHYKIVWSE